VVEEPLAALGLAGAYALRWAEGSSGGLRGVSLSVELLEPSPTHRPWSVLRQQLQSSPLEPQLRQRVLQVFSHLAEAEAAVHGHSADQVHFHEVGAIDALVDVVGVCAGLLHFDVSELICAAPPVGHGTVNTAHGLLPLPAPAVLELAVRHGVPMASSEGFPAGELTTPTGLALMATWASRFAAAPPLVPLRVGVGLGTRQLDRPNLLRLWLARDQEAQNHDGQPGLQPILELLLQQQAQVDDATPEDLAFLIEELRAAGALEVFSQPIQMKKGRTGLLLTVLAPPERSEALRRIWWIYGTSLGVREHVESRWRLPRAQASVETPWGAVRVKEAFGPDGVRSVKPEYEDLAALARRHGLSLRQLRAAVLQAWETRRREAEP
jgi:uncharacterized protein (TIGR00299 family) protein